MTDLPDLKIKAQVSFPASVSGRIATTVQKLNGEYFIDHDVSQLPKNSGITPDQVANSWMTIWNAQLNAYQIVPYALAATGGVSNIDGKTGTINLGTGLSWSGQTINNIGVLTFAGKNGALAIDATLTLTGSTLSVTTPTTLVATSQIFDTRASAIVAMIPAVITSIIIRRYTSSDPLSDAPYKRGGGLSAPFTDGLGAQWGLDLSAGTVNPLWFGVKGDGVTANDTAWQAALSAAVAIGGKLAIPPGSFLLNTTLVINGRVTIEGVGCQGDNGLIYGNATTAAAFPTNPSGWMASVLVCGTNNGAFIAHTQQAVTLKSFQIFYPAQPSASTVAIALFSATGTSGVNTFNVMRDLCIIGSYNAMTIDNCLDFVMDSVIFLDNWGIPLQLTTGNSVQFTGATNAASFGDSTITNCTFFNTVGPYHIELLRYGGLRIVNNKFNITPNAAILIGPANYTDPGNPSNHEFSVEPLIITGNSIEGSPTGILFQPNATSHGLCDQVVITGNQIWATTSCISVAGGTVYPQWVSGVAITGNVLLFGNATGQYGVALGGANSVTISGNTFQSSVAGNQAVFLGTIGYAIANKIRMSGNIDSSFATLPGEVTPTLPASNVPAINNNPHPVVVIVTGGTKTGYVINGVSIDQTSGGSFMLRPGDTIAIVYTGTPSWHWYANNP